MGIGLHHIFFERPNTTHNSCHLGRCPHCRIGAGLEGYPCSSSRKREESTEEHYTWCFEVHTQTCHTSLTGAQFPLERQCPTATPGQQKGRWSPAGLPGKQQQHHCYGSKVNKNRFLEDSCTDSTESLLQSVAVPWVFFLF